MFFLGNNVICDIMAPEEEARQDIDALLKAAGWVIQDLQDLNLGASLGVVVREVGSESGPVDYLLFVDRVAVGVIEAKPKGTTLSGIAEQSGRYIRGIPDSIPHVQEPLPFAYESTGVETFFRDLRDPFPRSRRVFAFHMPETLRGWLSQGDTLRGRLLRNMPSLPPRGLWDCQFEAVQNLEKSLAESRPRALIQMATGSGKTYTAVSFIYRLIKFGGANRVLFLVDRNNLGRQTMNEFSQYVPPDDNRKFTELYNVQHMKSNTWDPVSKVCITTIQRLYSMLRGELEFDSELEEVSLFDSPPIDREPMGVVYNPQIPIEAFDFIITDECHRSIYNLWRQVLEYFDAFLVGLTATPSKQTLGFFNKNLVMEYGHERAVADGVNVGYDVYRIHTKLTQKGSVIPAHFYVDKRDRLTRRVRWEQLDEDLEYSGKELDRSVVAVDQIRTVIRTFRDKLFTEIFPGRPEVPKTLIFAKDDSHAEDIVHIIREEFARGNDFCKKITYKTTGQKPEDLIIEFRNSYNPRIAVTVDMISTGTNIKPLECLVFMRDVKSRTYFEQMKGRGTRTISSSDLSILNPGVLHKTHFMIVDAVGVCENDKTDSRPLDRKRGVGFDKLMTSIAFGDRSVDALTSMAARLSRLDRKLSGSERREIEEAAGRSLREVVNGLFDAVDSDKHLEKARGLFGVDEPSEGQLKEAGKVLADDACRVFDNPVFRNTVSDVKKRSEQVIDTVSEDEVILSGFDSKARDRAKAIVGSFEDFLSENRDEITALQIIYDGSYRNRHLTYRGIKELAEAIKKPPYNLTAETLWTAYEQLEKSKVQGAGPKKLLTDIVSLVRFAIGRVEVLEPFYVSVDHRFNDWLDGQEAAGKKFSEEQREWLHMIKNHIATSGNIEIEDFENVPFNQKGGPVKLFKVFGNETNKILKELNEVLTI